MSDPAAARFTCTLSLDAGQVGHLVLPFDPRERFGRARPPLIVSVNGHTWRSTVAVMAGEAFVPFRRSHREAAGVAPGDTVEVTLTLDTQPRIVEAPEDLVTALGAADARAGWERLSYSHQREWVESIEQAKRPETRAKRIAAAVATVVAPRGP